MDYEIRLTYNYDKSDSDAAAIVGTGEFGFEAYANVPFGGYLSKVHNPTDVTAGASSLGLELGYATTTNKKAFDSLQRTFVGLGFATSQRFGSEQNPRWFLLNARLGWGSMDTLTFVNETTREVATINDGLPRYERDDAIALETDIIMPLNDDAFLTLGGRIYNGPNPNPWSVYVGYTTSITKIGKALFGFGDGEEGDSGTKSKDANGREKPASPSIPSL